MMPNKVLLSLATVALFAATAKADTTYSVDESVNWFEEIIAGSASAPTSDGSYNSTPTVAGSSGDYYIDLDTAASSPLLFTPTSGASSLANATKYRVDVKIKKLIVNAGESSLPTTAEGFGNVGESPAVPYASIAAVDNSGNKWYGWNGSTWTYLDTIAAPTENSSYDVVIEFFVESSLLKIKYTVGTESYTLQHASATALPSLTKVGFAGCGQFQNFSGSGVKTTFSVETTKTEEELKTAGLTVKAGQTVAQALNDTGANGLQQWQSLALGINPSTSTKPYTAPVQTGGDDAGKLGFAIGNYGTPSVDMNVSFTVYELDSLDDITPTAKVTESAGETALVDAPSEVKYYKIKVTFGSKTNP